MKKFAIIIALTGVFVGVVSCSDKRFIVQSESMYPNFRPGDEVIIDTEFDVLLRGDVVIVESYKNNQMFYTLRRVIGLPDDVIEIIPNGIMINETSASNFSELGNRGIDFGKAATPEWVLGSYSLEADSYFLIGDNLEKSLDSRHNGPVSIDKIIGRVR